MFFDKKLTIFLPYCGIKNSTYKMWERDVCTGVIYEHTVMTKLLFDKVPIFL